MGRLQRSWELAKASWRTLTADRERTPLIEAAFESGRALASQILE